MEQVALTVTAQDTGNGVVSVAFFGLVKMEQFDTSLASICHVGEHQRAATHGVRPQQNGG